MNEKSKILVAEDNAALGSILKFNLQKAGFEVSLAKNGKIAAQWFKEKDFDLIVSDQQMPHMTGIELCRFVRFSDKNSTIPFILLTAKAFELDEEELENELQIRAVLHKPFSPTAIVTSVNGLLANC